MGRGATASSEIIEEAVNKKIPILLIQEPYTRGSEVVGLGKYSNSIITGNNKDETPWACIVILDKRYTAVKLSNLSNSHVVAVHVSGPYGDFCAVSMYCQFSLPIQPFMRDLEEICRKVGERKLIVASDLNAISPLWNHTSNLTDERGRAVEDLIAIHQLTFANKAGELPTFRRGQKSIDATLMSLDWSSRVSKWEVLDGCVSSDHRAILITIQAECRAKPSRERRFCTKKANWQKFEKNLAVHLAEERPCDSVQHLDEYVRHLTKAVLVSAEASIPRKKRYLKSVPWWSHELTKMKRHSHRARKQWQNEQDPTRKLELRSIYRSAVRDYTRNVYQQKKASWRRFVEESCEGNPYGIVYKMFNGKMTPDKALSCINMDNEHTKDWTSTVTAIMKGLLGEETAPEPEDSPITSAIDAAGTWSHRQIITAIHSLKNGKAPGPDNIEVEMLKHMTGKRALHCLSQLFNSCRRLGYFPNTWKNANLKILLKSEDKDETQAKSYRPICLLPILSKVLEKLINKTLEPVWLDPARASCRQYGYRRGRSTEDAIFDMVEAVRSSNSGLVLALMFDVTGAFDNLGWGSILAELQ
uniref:Reverse transcriptase domain-containing protein n=1 Tax=Trichogramma kaykai TaxID=54128 RepID=A0ABD2XQQ1_9HYME